MGARCRHRRHARRGPGLTAARVVVGDITRLDEQGETVDVIVNAANEQLAAGSGVCGAIFAAAGPPVLADACAEIGGCPTGAAVDTPAFALEARGVGHIVHAVGPVFGAHDPAESDRLLASTYRSVLADRRRPGSRHGSPSPPSPPACTGSRRSGPPPSPPRS